MLGETELAYTITHVRVYRGENFAEGFERLHPYRKLPVLDDHDAGSHRVFESGAILVYLAEKAGMLFGDGPIERSDVMQWLMLQMSSVGPLVGQATHFNRTGPKDEPYALRRFVTQTVRLCELYDARLAETPYLAGESYSIADIATLPWLWRHPANLGLDMAAYPNIQRWIGEIRARPGFKRGHERYKTLVEADTADVARADPEVMDRFLGRGRWLRTP
jgi:GST-like protein